MSDKVKSAVTRYGRDVSEFERNLESEGAAAIRKRKEEREAKTKELYSRKEPGVWEKRLVSAAESAIHWFFKDA